ncbi:MAG: beta-lactamase family protein, partial [Sandarakinorhabdus sp.]|nr:beta-lactamase family protein [Sandarakinorhabdus sp.]
MKPLVTLVVIAALCVTSSAAAQTTPEKSGAAGSNAVTDAPLTSAQQDAIDRYVTAEMARQRIPGLAIGVYRRGYPLFLKSYGLANIEWQTPVGTDTRMQTGSLGKQFVATAILRLAEQGKVDINASITKYFPEAPASWRPITVANLLSHTSGIGVYDTPENTDPGGKFDYRRDFT